MPAIDLSDAYSEGTEISKKNAELSKSGRFLIVIRLSVALLSLVSSLFCAAQAQTAKEPWEELDKRVNASENIAPLGNDLLGDRVGLQYGDLSFSNTDVSLPGNNTLPVTITRTLSVGNRRGYHNDSMAADWEIDLPSISGVYGSSWIASGGSTNRCSVSTPSQVYPDVSIPGVAYFDPYKFWHGLTLNIPSGGGELLLKNSASPVPTTPGVTYYWVTNGLTAVSCLPSIANNTGTNGNGEGFLALTADGTKYWFNWMAQYYEPILKETTGTGTQKTTITLNRRRNVLYATRVEDRLGNYVTYTYTNTATQPGKLTRIQASDGRQIDITYNTSGQISGFSDGTRNWTYQYGNVSTADGTYKTLTAVVLPDQSRWTFDFSQFSQTFIPKPLVDEGSWTCLYPPEPPVVIDKVGTVIHPSGAQGRFQVGVQRHSHTNVPTTCLSDTNDQFDQERMVYVNAEPIAWDTFSLKQNRSAARGLARSTGTIVTPRAPTG